MKLYRNTNRQRGFDRRSMQRQKWACFRRARCSLNIASFLTNRKYALLAAQLTSIMSVSSTSDVPPGIFDTPIYSRRRSYELLNPKVGVLEYGEMEDAVFQIAITLDPLSETAQKWSSIIKVSPIIMAPTVGVE